MRLTPFSSYPASSILLAFILFLAWMILSFIASRLGWSQLSKRFKCFSPIQGQKFNYVSCKVGAIRYFRLCRFIYNEDGIYLKLPYLFKLFHSPLFIPWQEVKTAKKMNRITGTVLHMDVRDRTVEIPYKIYEKLKVDLKVV